MFNYIFEGQTFEGLAFLFAQGHPNEESQRIKDRRYI
jgi:hypothetical protein